MYRKKIQVRSIQRMFREDVSTTREIFSVVQQMQREQEVVTHIAKTHSEEEGKFHHTHSHLHYYV